MPCVDERKVTLHSKRKESKRVYFHFAAFGAVAGSVFGRRGFFRTVSNSTFKNSKDDFIRHDSGFVTALVNDKPKNLKREMS